MTQLGYALSSEEHSPTDLVNQARRAEEVGFSFALISDHYHPWVSRQGHAPFVWSVIGGIAQVTKTLQLGTGVTCPTIRIHPAIIAQAAATAASMMPGRFFLGVGTGENLNEHITGEKWQPYDIRLAMLEEAVEVIRTLWEGGAQSFWGSFYTVEDAQIFSLPDELPPIMVAASGPKAATTAGRMGDGLINTAPDAEVLQAFEAAGGEGPRFGQLTVCWAASEAEARRTAFEIWPNAGLKGQLSQEIRTVTHFEQACQMLTEESATEELTCGPDAARYIEKIQKFADAGYDHVYLHQIGPDQEGFFRFCERELLPHFSG
ncbi:MAG: TIGR03557 family F420-dependent LLM class oxidoreductase [Chloroflexi bacterium]|nr:TIGR03557 family F420-dependent LLM class oxidoreductase [Chloroflexota bacterium]